MPVALSELKNFFIAEGLLMYLAGDWKFIWFLFGKTAANTANSAFTFMERQVDDKIAFRNSGRNRRFLAENAIEEPFRSGFKLVWTDWFFLGKKINAWKFDSAEILSAEIFDRARTAIYRFAEGESLCLKP